MSDLAHSSPARALLIVDDNPSVRDALRYVVERRGYSAATAASGAEALALAGQQAFDGAMIDINMPGMNGLALCRALVAQARAAGHSLAVWMITGARTAELAKASLEAGALTLLAKPFEFDELGRQFDQHFGELPAEHPPAPPPSGPI